VMMPCMTRAIWSAPPPVPAGTMISMGLLGSHACAGMEIADKPPTQMAARLKALVRIFLLLEISRHGRSFVGSASIHKVVVPVLCCVVAGLGQTLPRLVKHKHFIFAIPIGISERDFSPRSGIKMKRRQVLRRGGVVWLRG